MKVLHELVISTIVGGLVVVLPLWLTVLLLLKAVETVAGLVRPLAALLPGWAAPELMAFLILLVACALIGLAVRTARGRSLRERLEKSFFDRLPGYALFRSLTQQLTGKSEDTVWKPALAEIEDALVPAFIVEELDDGSYTVFVPSAPTPLAGAVYVLDRARVHPVEVPFTQAIRCVSRWGTGTHVMVAAMKRGPVEAQRRGRGLVLDPTTSVGAAARQCRETSTDPEAATGERTWQSS